MQRLKESPRTVSALIIILIVAAAIYAFSGDRQQGAVEVGEEVTPASDEVAAVNDIEETGEVSEGEVTATPVATPEAVDQQTLTEESKSLPEATKTDRGYTEVAQANDGITHLARRAATRWLSENNAGYQVTNEHRIYIEDYIQNRVGTEGLNLNETRTINFELIQEAVAAAGNLNEQQLRNLSQYTAALS